MRLKAVHQFHPALTTGDGVSSGMLFARRLLRELGFASEIYCERAPPGMDQGLLPLSSLALDEEQLLLVHHSLGYDNAAWLNDVRTPKVLVYHNITPEHLLPPNSEIGLCARLGREQLTAWAGDYLGAIGDSDTNSDELRAANYRNVLTLPLLVDTERVRGAPWDASVAARLRGAFNLLFVGRICANKRQLELIEVLAEFMRYTDQPTRLILAGGVTSHDYLQQVEARIRELGLQDNVVLTGKVPAATLTALYRNADAFVSMSEHEGFGMPLIEAMLFDVPVLAHAASSIPGTMGEGGLLTSHNDPAGMAATLHMLLTEPALRRRTIAGQRRNLARFAPAHLRAQLAAYLTQLDIEIPQPPAMHDTTPAAPYWQIEGPFDSSYSLALVNRELARALSLRGADVGLRSMEGQGDFPPSAQFLASDPSIAALSARALGATAPPDAALRFCYPPHVDDMPAAARLIHSYGWEETGFPAEYVAAFNRRLDLVTVLSTTVEKILRDNGVRVPIAVTGGGVDHLLNVIGAAPELPQHAFRFLHVSSCFPRKGVDALLAAYGQAFRASDDVSLVIKTFPNPHNDVARQLAVLQEFDADYPHVTLIDRDCSAEELVGLYQACDAFVAPSRGEGLGLPLAEAMLFNLPVITTAWGGQRDFCEADIAWLCDYQFTRTQTHFGQSHSVWAEPDVDHLAQLLRIVHALPDDERARRTADARYRILQNFTWARVAGRTERAIAALAQQPALRHEPAIGWISTWNKRCGIAGYSSFLTGAIPADRLTVFADRWSERLADDGAQVVRCWTLDFAERLDDLYDAIIARGIGAVVIQYNFGFFSLNSFSRFILRLKRAGIGVHGFFHATGDLILGTKLVSLGDIAGALGQADRLYVHSVQDLNRLKKHGLVDNVVLFPQGVVAVAQTDANAAARRSAAGLAGKKILGSYGFLLPHKGLQALIQAFAQLAADDPDLHLLMVNALYPIPESNQERDDCLALIAQLGLRERVTLVSDFLPEEASLDWLAMADLIVFPYQRTQESSSAAVRMGLAAGRPVVVTPLAIFDDVNDAVHHLSGVDAPAIATGLRELLDDPERVAAQEVRTRAWLAARQWPLLSRRLLNIIDGIANPLEAYARND